MQRILLLEDDRNLNRGISLKLEKEGYEVSSAFSAGEKIFWKKIQLALDLLVQMRYNNLGFLKMLEWLSR